MSSPHPSSPPALIVAGVGRSGSTMLHALLARHPETAWISGLANRFPDRVGLNRQVLRAADWPVLGSWVRSRFTPSEHWVFWERIAPGISTPYRDLRAEDLIPSVAGSARTALTRIPTARRSHLVLKVTGWPRIGYLDAMLPDARFVHLVRDGRAVALSLTEQDWWWGWRGPSNWRLGPLSPQDQADWDATGNSFYALAALQWRIQTDLMEASATALGDRYLLVRYEDLCADPVREVERICEFAGLDVGDRYRRILAATEIRLSDRWLEKLGAEQVRHVESIIGAGLRRYGYSIS